MPAALNNGINRVKLRKSKTLIEYSPDGMNWYKFYEGSPENVSRSWDAILLGYCNDDLTRIIHNYNKTQKENNLL